MFQQNKKPLALLAIVIFILSIPTANAFLPLEGGNIIIQTTTVNGKQGTYNQTQANNVTINSGGYKINFINGTGATINVKNSNAGKQVNVTISAGAGSGVSSLNSLTGALTIACVSGNTTCTTSGGNTITINTAWNVVTTGLSAQTITKQITLNNLVLGGQMNLAGNTILNTGIITVPTTTGTLAETSQLRTYQNNTGSNLGTSGIGPYSGMSGSVLQFLKLTSANNNCSFSGNTTNVILTCVSGSSSGSQLFDADHASGSTSLVGPRLNATANTAKTISGGNGISFSNANTTHFQINQKIYQNNTINNLAQSVNYNIVRGGVGNVTVTNSTNQVAINLGSNVVVTGGNNQTLSKALNFTLGQEIFVPRGKTWSSLNIGTQLNPPISLRQGDVWIQGSNLAYNDNSNMTQILSVASAIHSLNNLVATTQTFANTANITVSSSINVHTIKTGSNYVMTNGAFQIIAKPIQINQLNDSTAIVDDNDATKKITWDSNGMTTGVTTTIRNNATSSQGINIPATRETETFAMKPQTGLLSNSTTQTLSSLTSSYRMVGYPVSITPQITGNVKISFTTSIADATATDGCSIELFFGTGSAPHSGAGATGTLIGFAIPATSATASASVPLSINYAVTGLVLGTTYWIEPALETITAGTCSVKGGLSIAQEY